jgi:hypothetical protein
MPPLFSAVCYEPLAKAGVTYGVYTLNDFLNGVLPPTKVYIFENTNYLTDA